MTEVAPPQGSDNPLIVTPEPVAPEPAAAPETPTIPEGYYPKDYVESLRKENQQYRERFQPFEQTFGEFDDEDRQAWLQLAQMAREEDPNVRAELAKTLGFELPPDETPNYLTMQDFEALSAQREAQRVESENVERIFTEAESLGYQRNTAKMAELLGKMNWEMEVPDVKKAHEMIEAEKQQIINDYLTKKGIQAEVPMTHDIEGVPGRPEQEIKNLKDSRRAAEARMAGFRNQ